MAHKLADRVKETTTATGTGNLALDGAISGFAPFSDRFSTNDTFFYCIQHQSADQWETGYGVLQAGPAIARSVIFATSDDTTGAPTFAPVNFSAGTKEIFITPIAGGVSPKAPLGVAPSMFEARLTLETGVAVSTTDQTAKTTIYLTPYNGNRIAINDGVVWWGYTLNSDLSLSLASLIKGVTYDIFIYDNGTYWGDGTMAIAAIAWKKVTASNNPAAGSSVTINIADTGTPELTVGQRVTVKDGVSSEVAYVTAVVTNTSVTVDTLANSYTTPDVYGFRERAATSGLALLHGVYVRGSGNEYQRYVGTFTISGTTTGQSEDSAQRRLVWNEYNRVSREFRYRVSTASWNYSTATVRQMNNDRANQIECTVGRSERPVSAHGLGLVYNSTTTPRLVQLGLGVNKVASFTPPWAQAGPSSTAYYSSATQIQSVLPLGFNYVALLEYGNGTDTQTWVGNSQNTEVSAVWDT